jgi:hypothetical protein
MKFFAPLFLLFCVHDLGAHNETAKNDYRAK